MILLGLGCLVAEIWVTRLGGLAFLLLGIAATLLLFRGIVMSAESRGHDAA